MVEGNAETIWTNLEQLTWEGWREEIKKAFRLLYYEFIARDRLSRIKHQSKVAGYMAPFYEVYYLYSNLLE